MKIEKINDNQIKCTLTRSDLASRQLRLSELAYSTEKARGLFQDMMDQANLEFGFDASDIPLVIEAIPVSMDCIILMITKVENPDEIDTRVSSLSSLKDLYGKDSGTALPADASSAFSAFCDKFRDEFLTDLDELTQDPSEPAGEMTPDFSKVPSVTGSLSVYLFSFDSLETVMDFAYLAYNMIRHPGCDPDCTSAPERHDNSTLKSTLYKSSEDGRYYLEIRCGKNSTEFARIFGTALEYGKPEPAGIARSAYMKEHFELILKDNAIQSLAYV